MSEAFFEALGPDRFRATELTRGPWDPGLQHAGPPAALLGRSVERHGERSGLQVARITFDIVRPLPIAELQVTTRLLRGGRSVELVEATLRAGEAEVMRATALRIRRTVPFFPTGQDVGYHTAMESRFVAGSFLELGPATVWMRMRHPLVPGESPSPLCRVLVAADSGNGVSAALDYQHWRFINPDLTVYLRRLPAGDWVALEATTTATAGVGLADTTLHDEHGPIGRSAQALFVDRR
jgi:hypothetical protein